MWYTKTEKMTKNVEKRKIKEKNKQPLEGINIISLINFLHSGLTGASSRQEAISENIANADTPGYKRREINFQEVLSDKLNNRKKMGLQVTEDGHIKGSKSVSNNFNAFTRRTSVRNDKNNVDIDVEMAEMAKNNIYYNTLLQQVGNRFSMLNEIIDTGGR